MVRSEPGTPRSGLPRPAAQRPRRGSPGPPPPPRGSTYSSLRPLPARHNHLLPAALIVSSILHLFALAGFVMHPATRQKAFVRSPMMVKLIELPAGIGGATQGTPGRTPERVPPKEQEPPPLQKPSKVTLPGKVPPKPSVGPTPIRTHTPGQTVGLGHGGPAGLGGKGAGVLLDEPTFQYEWYKARLEDALKAHWRRPVASGPKVISASVHFIITVSGQVERVEIVSSSNNPAFDQTILRAVYDSVPFPKFPPLYEAPSLGVLYTFELTPEN